MPARYDRCIVGETRQQGHQRRQGIGAGGGHRIVGVELQDPQDNYAPALPPRQCPRGATARTATSGGRELVRTAATTLSALSAKLAKAPHAGSPSPRHCRSGLAARPPGAAALSALAFDGGV